MKFSNRILDVKPSPTLAVTAMAKAMKAQGIDILDFGSGEPDFDTPEFIKKAAIEAINSGKTKYTPAGGIPDLKRAVIEKLKRDNNLDFSIDEITINCGGKHSFFNLMQVLLQPGDEILIPSPYWVSYPSMVSLADGVPVVIDTKEETGFKITPDQLKSAINHRTRGIVINSPSNPTGSAYTKEELLQLAEVLKGTDILILSDDIYESIVYDGFKFHNIASLVPELKPQTIVLNAVSKTYSMTGWRIGYIAGPKEIIKHVETLQSQSTSNPTSISQWAAIAAISGDQSVIETMLEAFTRRRKIIVDGLNSIPGFSCRMPEGAFYAFPGFSDFLNNPGWKEIEGQYEGSDNSSKVCSFLLKEARIAAVPGIAFGIDNYMRLSFATSDNNITEGISRIMEAVKKIYK